MEIDALATTKHTIRRDISNTALQQKDYERALRHAGKEWADEFIKRFHAQKARLRLLTRYQQDNIADWTPAERAFATILDNLELQYERERCLSCDAGDYFIDFLIREPMKIAFEIDGGVHKNQQNYDAQRDLALMAAYKIPIVRFTNEEVLNSPAKVRQFIIDLLATPSGEDRLTKRDAPIIRRLFTRGVPQDDIAYAFSVSPATIEKIVQGKIWQTALDQHLIQAV
jgi:very-short-patch-repair endonuclease